MKVRLSNKITIQKYFGNFQFFPCYYYTFRIFPIRIFLFGTCDSRKHVLRICSPEKIFPQTYVYKNKRITVKKKNPTNYYKIFF